MDRGTRRTRTKQIADRRIRLVTTLCGRQVAVARAKFARDRNPYTCGLRSCWLCKSQKLTNEPLPRDARRQLPDEQV